MLVLSGTVDSLHLGDLLEWLHLTRASGRLLLSGSAVTRAFDVVQGRVTFASSSRAAERLASWLLRKGIASRQALLRALAIAQTTGAPFTEIVENDAGVDHPTLVEAGRSLATALASRALREPRLVFRFDPDWPVTDRMHVDLQLDCSKLILQAAYAADTRPPAETGLPAPPETLDPDAIEALFWHLMADLDGEVLDAGVVAAAHDGLAAVGRILHRWVTQGPPLLPLAPGDVDRVAARLAAGEPFSLEDSPTMAWDLLSLVNGIDAPGFTRATSVAEAWVMAGDEAPGLVRLLIDNSRWRRERAGDNDTVLRRAALARAAAARCLAPVLGLGEETAAAAATLPVVILDLVLTALSHAPLTEPAIQRAALYHLLPLVGHAAACAAGHPDVLLHGLTGRPPHDPGARVAALAVVAARGAGGGFYPSDDTEGGSDFEIAAAIETARIAAQRAVAEATD